MKKKMTDSISPQHLIFTTMKNEGPFMLEWIAYNLSLGFDGFIIYTNDCVDGTDQIAERLEEMGIVDHVPNPIPKGRNPQHRAINRARSHPWVLGAEWLMCLDADEFINVRVGDRTIQDVIKSAGEVDAISLAWKLFGCGGVEEYDDKPITEQFFFADDETNYANGRAYGLKTLFRNNGSFGRFGPHRPKDIPEERIDDVRWADSCGNLLHASKVGWRAWPDFDHSNARIHHYSVRSVESFMVKRDRGRTNHINVDQAEEYWMDMNVNRHEDTSIKPLSARAAPKLKELLADPVLSKLHATACDWHREKISELKKRTDWDDFRDWLYANKIMSYPPKRPNKS